MFNLQEKEITKQGKLSTNYIDALVSNNCLSLKYKVGGVVILPIFDDNNILLLKIFRESINEILYELPRGFSETCENCLVSAERELKEETNLDSCNNEFLGSIIVDSGISNNIVDIVVCKIHNNLESKIKLQEKENIKDFEIISIDNVKKMIVDNEIKDSFTICAIFKYLNFKK